MSFEATQSFTKQSFNRMSKQTTISGLKTEVDLFANHMEMLQLNSPITATWTYEGMRGMDVNGHPRLEKLREGIATEMLIAGDAAGPSYYTAQPIGRPFRRRVKAASPFLTAYMRVASQLSRKNAVRSMKGIKTISR